MSEIRTIEIEANGLAFHCLEQGSGPLVLCLHGFPDHAWTFRRQLAAFSERGFRVVAPFMRGYAPTAVPADGRYQSAVLAQDAAALIDAFGARRAILVGHDWGATAAYATAVLFPEKIDKLVTIAVPYGPALRDAMIHDPAQQKRSWYMYLFQTALGEAALADDDFALIDRLWHDWSPGWTPPPGYLDTLKRSFRQPGVPLAALTYYRQNFRRDLQDPALAELQAQIGRAPIGVPTLYLHGVNDGCIAAAFAGAMTPLFTAGLRSAIVSDAGHFAHLEGPDEVNRAIAEFIAMTPNRLL